MLDFDFAPLLQTIVTSLSLFAMGWWPCAACKEEDCQYCSGGNAPTEIEVEINGLADRDCYDCEPLNGVFVLTFVEDGSNGCCWRFAFAETCDFDILVACISNPIALGYELEVGLSLESGGLDVIVWVASLGDYAPDCIDWNGVDVPITPQIQTQCYDNDSTCKVTAV